MARIDAYRSNPIATPSTPIAPKPAEKSGFGEVLLDSMKAASNAEIKAEETTTAMVEGKADIHEAMIAQEKAGIALRFAVTLKNRAVEAYREIMNTQI